MPLILPRRRFLLGAAAGICAPAIVRAQSRFIGGGFFQAQNAGGASLAVSFTDSAVDSVDRSAYTFAAKALGASAADRKILVGAFIRYTSSPALSISSLSVDGISASAFGTGTGFQNGASYSFAQFWLADLSADSNTTGDIVVTPNTGVLRCAIAVYRLTGASSTPTASGGSGPTSNAFSANINVDAGGAVCAVAIPEAAGGTWSLATDDVDTLIESSFRLRAAHQAFATAQTPLTVTFTSSAALNGVMNCVSIAHA